LHRNAAEKISFRHVNRETGHRLRHQLVDSVTGEVVEPHNKGRGYEVGENQFLLVQDEELESAQQEARTRPFSEAPSRPATVAPPAEERPPKGGPALKLSERKAGEAPPIVPPPAPPRPIIENTRTIELDRFIPRDQLDPGYFNTPYYIVPRDEVGQEAFAVIRDAIAAKGLVGMGRVVLANRERPIIIESMGSGLRGITLRYAHEVRSEAQYFAEIPRIALPDEMLRITEHILETKKGNFDPAYLEDRYRTVLVEKLRERQAHMPAKSLAAVPSPQNVINLMDALKRSLAAEQPVQRAASATKPTPRRSAAATKPPPAKRPGARTLG
jgi:DNA end-binding protein Ku